MIRLAMISLLAAAHATAALPYEVTQLKAKREAEIAKIDMRYGQALESLKVRYTKDGNLEAANAVQALLDEMGPVEALVGENFIRQTVSGASWKQSGTTKVITFRSDGKISKSWGQLSPPWEVKNGKVLAEGTEFTLSKDAKSLIAKGGKKDGTWVKVP